MVLAEKIQQYIQRLPASFQAEVLDFVEYLVAKAEREALREERTWSDLSLSTIEAANPRFWPGLYR